MISRLLFAVLYAAMSIHFALMVNRRATVSRTVLCVTFPILFSLFVWDDWDRWHASSGNDALQYSIAFVLTCVALAGMLIALGRRLWWLRHHKHDRWTG